MDINDSKLNIKEFLDKDEQKDLLRFLTAGSVDDGKSPLTGRLMWPIAISAPTTESLSSPTLRDTSNTPAI